MNATQLTCGKLVQHALRTNKLTSRLGNRCEDPSATFTDCNHPTVDVLTVCLVGAFSLRFCTMVNHHFSPPFGEYVCFFSTTKQANLSGESTSRWLKNVEKRLFGENVASTRICFDDDPNFDLPLIFLRKWAGTKYQHQGNNRILRGRKLTMFIHHLRPSWDAPPSTGRYKVGPYK